MAAGEAQEGKKSGEGPSGEDEGGGGGEKKSGDSAEGAGAGAAEEKKVAGKGRRGRKPRGAPEAAGKKARRNRAAAEGKPAVERPARERKTVERFSAVTPRRAAAPKGVSIQEGPGTKLKDIPNVFFKLSKRRADENLQLLHTILFAKKAKALYLKRNIYQFSGFVWTENEEKQRAKVKEKLDKCVKDKLLDFCDILDIPVAKATTKKEEMSAKLLEFLESPHVTRDTLLAEKEQKGRKRKRRTKGTSEATSVEADSDIETKKRKKSNVPSTMKKWRKNSTKVAEEDVGSDHGMSVDSNVNQGEGGAEGSEDEKNDIEDEGDEQEPVVREKVSTQRQKGKSPAKSAKGSSGSLSKKAPSEGKRRGPGKISKGSSVEESKRGPKSSAKQEETTKKGSAMSNKSTLNSRTSAQVRKNDSRPYDASKQKADKSKSRENYSLTQDKNKKKGRQPGLAVSAKKQGKERAGGRSEPTREEVHAVVRGILKEVDFNTATLADILRQLGSEFGMDLMHRKAEVKSIIEEAINEMTDDEEDGENEDDEEAQDDVDA